MLVYGILYFQDLKNDKLHKKFLCILSTGKFEWRIFLHFCQVKRNFRRLRQAGSGVNTGRSDEAVYPVLSMRTYVFTNTYFQIFAIMLVRAI